MDENNNKKIEQKDNQSPNKTRRGRKPKRESSDEEIKSLNEQTQEKEQEKPTLEKSLLLLKEIGYKKISNKTFINEKDLNSFLNQDFSNINKTKALGFIQILQREYPVDLSELKSAYLEYYRGHKTKEKESSFVHVVHTHEKDWKKYLLWAGLFLVTVFSIWFLASKDRSISENLSVKDQISSPDINSNIVKKAEQNIIAFEQNTTVSNKADEADEADEEVLRVDKSLNQPTQETKTEDTNSSVKIGLEDDLDLDTIVKQMIKENNITIASEEKEEDNLTKEKVLPASQQTLKETKKVLNEPKKEIKVQKKTKPKPKVAIKPKKSKITTAKQKAIIKSKLYIQPLKKTWIGIIYLDDYTKKDFLVKSVFKLNSSRPQLIVVGHKFFEIYNQGYSYRFRGNGPVRFIYKDGDIMQINRNEFLTYSKGVNW